MKKWLQSRNFMRLLRLAIGAAIIYQGIDLQQWLFVITGGLLSLLPLLNIGCYGMNTCVRLPSRSKKNKTTS